MSNTQNLQIFPYMENGVIKLKILGAELILDYQVGPQCNHTYSYEISTQKRRHIGDGVQCDHRGRDWSDGARS